MKTREDIEAKIKDKLVQIENLLKLNVPKENKLKIEKIFFDQKSRNFSFKIFLPKRINSKSKKTFFDQKLRNFNFKIFLPQNRKIFNKVWVQTMEDIEVNIKDNLVQIENL